MNGRVHGGVFGGRLRMAAVLSVALMGCLQTAAAAANLDSVAGYVDGQALLDCAGEDAVTVEVRLSGTLIRLACSFEPDLCDAVRGIEMIQALILDPSALSPAAVKCMRKEVQSINQRLMRDGWERIAMIKEGDEEVRVLVLAGETTIDGLVVTAIGVDEVLFSNIAGPVDLEALRRLGEEMDMPGWGEIDLDEIERRQKEEEGR